MAYTQSDLDAIQSAIAKGARRVRLNGEEVEFRDLKDMERIEAKIKAEINQTNGKRIVYPQTSTGWR